MNRCSNCGEQIPEEEDLCAKCWLWQEKERDGDIAGDQDSMPEEAPPASVGGPGMDAHKTPPEREGDKSEVESEETLVSRRQVMLGGVGTGLATLFGGGWFFLTQGPDRTGAEAVAADLVKALEETDFEAAREVAYTNSPVYEQFSLGSEEDFEDMLDPVAISLEQVDQYDTETDTDSIQGYAGDSEANLGDVQEMAAVISVVQLEIDPEELGIPPEQQDDYDEKRKQVNIARVALTDDDEWLVWSLELRTA